MLWLGGLILFILIVSICASGYKSPRLEKERQAKENTKIIKTGNKLIDRIAEYINPTKLKRYYTICKNHEDITVQQMYDILVDNSIDVQYDLYDWFVSNGICEPNDYIEDSYKKNINWRRTTGDRLWWEDGYYTLPKKPKIRKESNRKMQHIFNDYEYYCEYCGKKIQSAFPLQDTKCPDCCAELKYIQKGLQ